MSEYQDYSYSNSSACHINSYILSPLLSLLDKKKNTKILDIGCGNGWLIKELLSHGFDAYGIDASVTGIQIANNLMPGRFFVQDISSSELPVELAAIKFDTLLSTEVIEHLYSPLEYLQFCANILKRNNGGEFLLTTPYHGYLKNLVLAVTGKMDAHFTVDWQGGHIKFWSKKTLTLALQKSGFSVTKFVGCGRMPYLWKSMLIKASI